MVRRIAVLTLCFWIGLGSPSQRAFAAVDAETLGDTISSGRVTGGSGVIGSGFESFKADLFTGSLSYGIPIQVAPGTNGVQPALALTYRSSAGNGWVGYGWSLRLPAVQRSTKHGVPVYVDDYGNPAHDAFVLGDDNLTEMSSTAYATEIESYSEITRVNRGAPDEYWEVKRKDGRVLIFGDASGTRIEKAPGQVFSWLLHTETDTHGNGITYEYDTATDPGVAYPSQITYTSHAGEGSMNTRTVQFVLESTPRPDPVLTYIGGFAQQTSFRLSQIVVKLGPSLIRRYDLTYDNTSSPVGRSLLDGVSMVGSDGLTAAPAQTFSYQIFTTAFNAALPWTNPSNADNYVAIRPARPTSNADYAILDVTGDGLADRITRNPQDNTQWKVYPNLGNGQGFAPTAIPWANPSASENGSNRSIRRLSSNGSALADLIDLDGDGRPDRVTVAGGDKFNLRFFRNTGNGFAAGVNWADPSGLGFVRKANGFNSGFEIVADLIDMNGDGLPDRVETNTKTSWRVRLNTGAGFSASAIPWIVPADTGDSLIYDNKGTVADVFDLNGDGLPDRVLATNHNASAWAVHFGTGSGFTSAPYPWPNPSYNVTTGDGTKIRDADGSGNLRLTVQDMNGDGLPDRVVANKNAGTFRVWPNTGLGFAETQWSWTNPSAADNHGEVIDVEGSGSVTVADLIDIDGDQLVDRVASVNQNSPWDVYFSNATPGSSFAVSSKPDLLSRVDNGLGGSVSFTYASSTKYLDSSGNVLNPSLPSPVITLASSTMDDGRGTSATTTYTYAGGVYDAPSREFRGFGTVTASGPAVTGAGGTVQGVSETRFNQDNQLKGTIAEVKLYQKTGASQQALMTNQVRAYHPDSTAPFERLLASTTTLTYDGQAGSRRKKMVVPSYQDGAPTEVQNLGEVTNESDPFGDGTNDEVVTDLAYASSGSLHVLNLPSHVTVTTGDPNTKLSEQWMYYDGLALGQAAAGDRTRLEEWLYDPTDSFTATIARTFAFDAFGNIIAVTDPNGHTIQTVFDPDFHSFPVATVLPSLTAGGAGMTITRTFDAAFGVNLTEKDLNGNVWRTSYDGLGRETGRFLTQAFWWEYPLSQTLYNDSLLGNPDDGGTGTPSAQHVTVLRYVRVGSSEALTAQIFFDGLGRTYRSESPGDEGRTIVGTTAYDAAGRVASTSVPAFIGDTAPFATTEYDALGRPVRSTNPDGTVLVSTFDRWSRTDELFSSALQSLRKKTMHMDAFERVASVEEFNPADPGGNAGPTLTTYAYARLGNLVMVVDHAGNTTAMVYDTLNRKVAMADPDSGNWQYEYDFGGNLTRQTDPRGTIITLTYDALDRLTSKTASGGGFATFMYDSINGFPIPNGLGRLVQASTSPFETIDFHYDALGNVIENDYQQNAGVDTIRHAYDLLGRETSTTYPDGEQVTRQYVGPSLKQITSPEAPGGAYLAGATYDALGRPLGMTLGNGATSTYRYNVSTTRLESARTNSPAAGTVLDLGYTFTPEGFVQSIADAVDPARSQSFSYDSLGRLLSAQGAYGSQTYRYDPIGNLRQKGSMTLDYTVGASTTGGPHAVKTAGPQTFDYDAAGNMIRMGTKLLRYDGFNQLSTVQENSRTLSSNQYDAFGRRRYHASPTAGVTSFGEDFDWDGQNGTRYIRVGAFRIAERTAPYNGFVGGSCGTAKNPNLPWSAGAGDAAVYALLLLSLELARRAARWRRPVYTFARIGGVSFLIVAYATTMVPGARALPINADNTVRQGTLFYVSDHLQSTTVLLDESGAVVRRVSYDPWGAIVSSTGSVDLEHKFTDQRLDSEAGLYYYGTRYYAPGIGRFVQADTLVPEPFDPQSLNRYAYTLNSPTNFTDPTGNYSIYDECPSCVGGGEGGGFGFGLSFSFGSGGVSSLVRSFLPITPQPRPYGAEQLPSPEPSVDAGNSQPSPDQELREEFKEFLKDPSNPCRKTIESLKIQDKLPRQIDTVKFYDVNLREMEPAGDYLNNASGSLGEYFDNYLNGHPVAALAQFAGKHQGIYARGGVFAFNQNTDQMYLLLHEMAHISRREDDEALSKFLNLTPPGPAESWSLVLSRFFNSGCRK